MKLHANAAAGMRENHLLAWDTMMKAFGISKKDQSAVKRQGCVRSFANMFYLVVIVGCELDLYGFMMAFSDYWNMGYLVVRILLVIGPIGYILAILMYMRYFKKEQEKLNDPAGTGDNETDISVSKEFADLSGDNEGSAAVSSEEKKTRHKQPKVKATRASIKLEYYHFMPVLRYYLVIKDKTNADVEGVFRVNSLSSFTLGIGQIISIIFQIFVARAEVGIFVKINIGSQIINWVLTILYFVTPISQKMSDSIKISALTSNVKDDLRATKLKWLQLTMAQRMEEAKLLEANVDKEIAFVGNFAGIDLSIYPADLKFRALGLLRDMQINNYGL